MPSLILYIVKLSAALALMWGFYQLLLRGLTFYTLNRWYLAGYSILSFVFPLVNIESLVDNSQAGEGGVVEYIPAIGQYIVPGPVHPAALTGAAVVPPFDWSGAVLWVIAAGAVVLLIRMLVRWLSLVRIRRSGRMVEAEGMTIYEIGEDIRPFSFGKAVYINPQLHTEKEWGEIILHEYVHIRQGHTVDILLAELVCILNWYNPFSWLIRRSIRQNLEFIADRQVLSSGVDRAGYQYHLLKVLGETRYRLANNFNFSSLKKRIIMMNKMRSARLHLVKFLFIVPLVAVLLVAFRDKYADWWRPAAGQVYANAAGIVISSSDNSPVAGAIVREKVTGMETMTDANGYYKLHIPVTKDSIRIRLDYSKEGYDTDFRERFIPHVKESFGMLDVGTIMQASVGRTGGLFFIAPSLSGGQLPVDPDYEDALQELHRIIKENKELGDYIKMQKDHPEVGLFYITEDKQRRIVIHTDGTIEKYGYPDQPSLDDMDKKYGALPGFMTHDDHPVNKGYLSRWAGISARAEREFHTTGTDAKAIIFPGDSRVIVVPVTGKPRFYDMDNGAAKERAEFESKYGPLPACVPPPGFNTDATRSPASAGSPGGSGRNAVPGRADHETKNDTVPKTDATTGTMIIVKEPIPMRALYVVDGQPMPKGWTKDSISTDKIYAIDVLKGEKAYRYFGEKGADGVVVITTNAFYALHRQDMHGLEMDSSLAFRKLKPLYIVDEKELPADSLPFVNPATIESISVIKDSAAIVKYGVKGKNGVVIIHLKKTIVFAKPQHSQIRFEVETKDGMDTVTADTLRIASLKVKAYPVSGN